MQIKVLHIGNYSHSIISTDPEEDIYQRDWNVRLALQIKKYYPEIEIEVWNIEKEYEEIIKKELNNLVFKCFPVNLSLRIFKEISFPLLNELKKEINSAKKQNKKLIIHLHGYHNWNSYMICKKFRGECIIAQHHGERPPLDYIKRYKWLLPLYPFFLIEEIIEKKTLKGIKQCYWLTEEERDYLKKLGVRNRFSPMGCNENLFKKLDKSYAKQQLRLEGYKNIILFVGRITRNKGIKYLLGAMKDFLKNNPRMALLLVGEGDLEGWVKKVTTAEKLETQILLTGRVPPEKMVLYYNAADLFILPSLNEGVPVTIIESLFCETPVLASDVGGIRFILPKKNLFPPKNEEEIKKYLKSFFINKDFFKIDREEIVKRFSWREITKRIVRDYYRI